MAWNLSRHRAHLSQGIPTTVHNDRFVPPTLPSGPAVHPHHHSYPYAIVSPASFTPDTPDFGQSPSSCYRHDSPHFTRPLSMSVLDDPAFSSDPRVHPHFPLTDASFYKELPSKSPVIIVTELSHTPPLTSSDLSPHQEDQGFISYSPESEDHPSSTTTSSTCVSLDSGTHTALLPSAAPHTDSPAHPKTSRIPSPELPLEFPLPSSVLAPPCHEPGPSSAMYPPTFQRPIPKRDVTAPEQRTKAIKPSTVQFQSTPADADGSNRREGKRRTKNFMRRLAGSCALDRIDEIDESDSFGHGRHYSDPFEAIGSNLARLGPAHMYNDVDILRGEFYNKSNRENTPSSVHAHKSARMPHNGANRPSRGVVPGQIFRHSPILSPSPHISQSNDVNDIFRHKLGSEQTKSRRFPLYHTIYPPDGVRPSHTSPHTPGSQSSPPPTRMHSFGDDIPPYTRATHNEFSSDPPHQIQFAPNTPPDHNEQYPETLLPPRGDAKPPSLAIVEPLAGQRIHLAPDFPRHRSTRSLDIPHTHTTRSTDSTSRTQNNSQAPRNLHLPKRLVMPAPLQPQSQQQYPPLYPQAHSCDHYADHDPLPLPDCNTHVPPVMCNQGRKLLRKKTAAFPGNIPLPTHAPAADAISPLMKLPFSNAENVKEGTRRRRLSKRKHDA